MVIDLLDFGADLKDSKKNSKHPLLTAAIEKGDYRLCEKILAINPDFINGEDEADSTALHVMLRDGWEMKVYWDKEDVKKNDKHSKFFTCPWCHSR